MICSYFVLLFVVYFLILILLLFIILFGVSCLFKLEGVRTTLRVICLGFAAAGGSWSWGAYEGPCTVIFCTSGIFILEAFTIWASLVWSRQSACLPSYTFKGSTFFGGCCWFQPCNPLQLRGCSSSFLDFVARCEFLLCNWSGSLISIVCGLGLSTRLGLVSSNSITTFGDEECEDLILSAWSGEYASSFSWPWSVISPL